MTTLAGVTQGYDRAGNLTLAYSADRGTSYKYGYDHHNRLTGVYDSTGSTRKAAFTWDVLGRRIEFACP
jgi:YD repeat-containing protein